MQFSPDGHWWWNGREWRPAAEAHRRRSHVGWLIGLSVLVALVGIGLCGPVVLLAGSHASSPTGYATSVTRAVSNCSPQPCADAGGFKVHVESVEWNYVPPALFQPEPGNQFARITVRFQNSAPTEKHADPFQFVLKDQQGVKHAAAVAGDGWSGVNLSPGGRFGPRSIDFQVTKGTEAGTLVWTPDFQDHEIPLS